MNLAERNFATRALFANCQQLLERKGASYAPGDDAYANFSARAALLNTSPEAVMLSDTTKHLHALHMLISGAVDSPLEDIQHRCMDAINYLALIAVNCGSTDEIPL